MRISCFILTIVSLFVATAVADPTPIHGRASSCMSRSQASQVASNFATLINAYSDNLANKALASSFKDYSDSVNTLIDGGCLGPQTLGSATFTSRAAFEAGQATQPSIPFQQLNLWHTCDTVFLRWRTALQPEFVTGLIVLETTKAPAGSKYPFLIQTVYSEFNSGAWLVDLGVFTPSNCSSS